MRIGSIGGVCVKIVNSVVCVAGHGGYGALKIDSKSISRDGIKRISLLFGCFGGTGGLVDVDVSAGVGTIFAGVLGRIQL